MEIDTSPRMCSGCGKTFNLTDYAPGYFAYKYQVSRRSVANTCPPCEVEILEDTAKEVGKTAARKLEQDIALLRTGVPQDGRHLKQRKRLYGF